MCSLCPRTRGGGGALFFFSQGPPAKQGGGPVSLLGAAFARGGTKIPAPAPLLSFWVGGGERGGGGGGGPSLTLPRPLLKNAVGADDLC